LSRLRKLRVRTRLAVTFGAVLLPLLAAELLAIWSFRRGLTDAAELELTNIVDHLYRVCALQRERALRAGAPSDRPRAEDLAFLRDVLGSFQVGRTGYAYVMEADGGLVIHPTLAGRNIIDSRGSDGVRFIERICKDAPRLADGRVGTIRYPWQDEAEGGGAPRMKILKYRWFAPWGWILAAGSYEEEVYGALGRAELFVLPLVVASVVLVVVLTLALSRWITRPLRQLSGAAAALAGGEPEQRVELPAGDEFGALARAFNAMADQIRRKTLELERRVEERTEELRVAQARLVQSMKLRALGDLVAGVAHEINNPLMASTTMLHVLAREAGEADAALQRRLDVLRRCNERIGRIVSHLRDFSRQSDFEPRPIPLALPLDSALLITGQQLLNHQIELRRELADDLPRIVGDPNTLEQVFLNLIANARDAMDRVDGPRVLTIRAVRAELDGRPAVAVSFADSGPGIPDEVREKMFEPFFTTKEVGRGTGLGLSIAYGIIEQHRGRIEVESTPGQGATFRIVLPAQPAEQPPPQEETP
jgi:two-component system NtrC family sensor kinase